MTRTKKRGPLPYEPSLVIPKTPKAACSIALLEELGATLRNLVASTPEYAENPARYEAMVLLNRLDEDRSQAASQ